MARRPPSAVIPVERRNLRRAVLSDLYHELMARSWGHVLGLCAVLYLVLNLAFAALYVAGGDCVAGAATFQQKFFFSVQTLSTIGYGTMVPTTAYAHVLVTVQAFTGTIFIAMTTGLVFAKFSRPTARVLWSRHAVIFERGGKRFLQIRMANERANQIVEAQLRVAFARTEVAVDGEQMRRFYDLALQRDRNVIFVLTWTATHEIDQKSPLYDLSLADLEAQEAQIICSLLGTDETFSQQVHARHYYGPDDLVFDRRFADIIGTNPDGSRYVDYARFHEVVPLRPARPEVAA